MENTTQHTAPPFSAARDALRGEHEKTGSWKRMAKKRKINVQYIYNFAMYGNVPSNMKIRKRLGIPVDYSELLSQPLMEWPVDALRWLVAQLRRPISDMHPGVLRWALTNRGSYE